MKRFSPEKLSHYILYVLIGVTVVIFLAYYLAGYENVGGVADDQTAPVLIGLLITFLFVMIFLAAVAAIVMLTRTLFLRDKKK
ncbi:MAG: hypothetical protein MJZ32_03355 [Bacteroidaceae bacterium]|nr:hypothetical protein [Bacteroidaceae bacterium]